MKNSPLLIEGVAETGPVREDTRSIPEMVLAAVQGALADAGLGYDDIDAVVTGSADLYAGLTASNVAVTEVVGAVMKPEARIAADGVCALIHAACQLWGGAYGRVLVVTHGKASMVSQRTIEQWTMDPIYTQPLEVDMRVAAGLQACTLADGDEQAEARWAQVAAERMAAAGDRAIAKSCSAEEILASPVVASPLREGMCAPEADSACALVLTVAGHGASGVTLTGVGHDLAVHSMGDRDLSRWAGLSRACERAYKTADLGESPKFDVLEPSCRYPHEEELFLAASGLSRETMLSPSGGLFGGAAPIASGLSRVIAAKRWLSENDGTKLALAHGTWGPAGQGQAVVVLEATS